MTTRRRIHRELEYIDDSPDDKILISVDDDDITLWHVIMRGPKTNGPYRGLKFTLTVELPRDYPETPPVITFTDDCFIHPNVSENGKCA